MKIFAFPHVIIYELVKQMEPVELIALSLCSETARAVVKGFARIKNDFEIRKSYIRDRYGLFFRERQQTVIWAALETELNCETFELESHRGFKLRIEQERNLCTYWKDVVHGCQEITAYVYDLFNASVSMIEIYEEHSLRILDFVQQLQEQQLKLVVTSGSHISAEGYSSILRCTATESLKVWSVPPPGYRFDGNLPPVKNLFISFGGWITRKQFLNVKSRNVRLRGTNLTMTDVNELLNCWFRGELPNLRFLECSMNMFRFYSGYPRVRLETVKEEISYTWYRYMEAIEFQSPDSFHILLDDKVVATIKSDGSYFTLVVWPDLNGKLVSVGSL